MVPNLLRTAMAAAVLAVIVAAILVIPSGESDGVSAYPSYIYGEVDYVIEDSGTGNAVYTYLGPDAGWSVEEVPYGSSFTVCPLSKIDGLVRIAMTGGSLDTLTLVGGDVSAGVLPVDVSFAMLGGEVSTLRVLAMEPEASEGLDDLYTLMFEPLDEVDLIISRGTVGDLVPTSDMVAVGSMSVEIRTDAQVHRMAATGYNGRYDSVEVLLHGGSVGYMTNQKSVVGTLVYSFENGSVDYFCIGADTENSTNELRNDLNTFYVQGETHVYIDESVVIRNAILGAGIMDVPSVLWNGDSAIQTLTKDVIIDASAVSLYLEPCFHDDRVLGTVLHFDDYTIGSDPVSFPISSVYLDYLDSLPVYGDGGVWLSSTDLTVMFGDNLYVDAYVIVPSGSTVSVDEGGRMVSVGYITLRGTISNAGLFINNGFIDKRGGSLEGTEP